MRNAVLPIEDATGWQSYVSKINAAWQKGVESILDVGRILIDAKSDPRMKHGSFEIMVREKLPFNERTAQRLMEVARHPVISKATHGPLLPPSWRTLYELTKVPEPKLIAAIKDGTVNPKMQRKDVKVLRDDEPRKASRAPPARGSNRNVGPHERCLTQVRALATACLREIPKEEWTRLIAELRNEIDEIEMMIEQQMGAENGHNPARQPA